MKQIRILNKIREGHNFVIDGECVKAVYCLEHAIDMMHESGKTGKPL